MTVRGRSPPPVIDGVFVSTFSLVAGRSLCRLAGSGRTDMQEILLLQNSR